MGGRGSRGGEDESYGKQQSKREGAREHRGGTKERGYRKRKRGFQQRTDSIIYLRRIDASLEENMCARTQGGAGIMHVPRYPASPCFPFFTKTSTPSRRPLASHTPSPLPSRVRASASTARAAAAQRCAHPACCSVAAVITAASAPARAPAAPPSARGSGEERDEEATLKKYV